MECGNKPILALTMGDACGIGPEVTVKAATSTKNTDIANIVVWGSPAILTEAVKQFSIDAEVVVVTNPNHFRELEFSPKKIFCFAPHNEDFSTLTMDDIVVGDISAKAGHAAYRQVVCATMHVLAHNADAIVTAPINKASINEAGIKNFCGHTELIAQLCDCFEFTMQQSSDELRCAFVTTHIALSEVCSKVNEKRIISVTKMLHDGIVAEGISEPKIAIAAINPHAGENGYMGKEDIEITQPAVQELIELGYSVEGPFPSDTLFIPAVRQHFDGIVCMYHDQGHIPFKMLSFDSGVNSTLGLPIIRTSVDHGTAFEIAWQGKADFGSLTAAIKLATIKTKK